MTQSTPELPVTQADHDALTAIFLASLRQSGRDRDDAPFLQILARHRIEHSTPDRNAVLELLREARAFVDTERDACAELGEADGEWMAKDLLARIDAALTTTPEPTDKEDWDVMDRELGEFLEANNSEPTAGVSEMADELEALIATYNDTAGKEPSHHAAVFALGRFAQRNANAILAALRTPSPVLEVAKVWEALKDQCCADPDQAKRCVMVSKDDLRAALQTINEV